MAEKQKPHDLRDEIYAPLSTVTNINDRLAGAPSSAAYPDTIAMKALRSEPLKPAAPARAAKA